MKSALSSKNDSELGCAVDPVGNEETAALSPLTPLPFEWESEFVVESEGAEGAIV